MSHTTVIETKFLDLGVLQAVCVSLGLEHVMHGEARLFDRSVHVGTVIRLPGWSYPIIVKADGTVAMDNYNGRWGNLSDLDTLKQEYAAEVVRREMRRKGFRFREVRENGKIKIVAQVGA